MSKPTGVFLFAYGVAIGSIATYIYTKKLYERKIQQVEETMDEVIEKAQKVEETADEVHKVLDLYNALKDEEPSKPSEMPTDEKDESSYESAMSAMRSYNPQEAVEERPYIISVEDFEYDDEDEYDKIHLVYFENRVLVDENMKRIVNIDDLVGLESLTQFEDGVVCVRNETLHCDFHILYEPSNYHEEDYYRNR